jgi:hypothetical protein
MLYLFILLAVKFLNLVRPSHYHTVRSGNLHPCCYAGVCVQVIPETEISWYR